MPSIENFYNTQYTPLDTGIDVNPNIRVQRFEQVTADALAELGVRHILIDYDGVLVPRNYGGELEATEGIKRRLKALIEDNRFESLSIATENGSQPHKIRRALGLSATTKIFSSYFDLNEEDYGFTLPKTTKLFWKLLLEQLELIDNPSEAVMIGDMPSRDIIPPQNAGMKTVLLDSMISNFDLQAARKYLLSKKTD